MLIYKITNCLNQKIYVGCTSKSIKQRFNQHVASSRRLNYGISRAISKYGAETAQQMYDKETYWIEKLGSFHYGYNMTKGGLGSPGKVHSQQSKERLRSSQLGRNHSEESKRKMSEAQKGKVFSEEHKRKLSNVAKSRTFSKETRQKMSDAMKVPIMCIETGQVFNSIKEACETLDLHSPGVRAVMNGKQEKTKGLTFKKLAKD